MFDYQRHAVVEIAQLLRKGAGFFVGHGPLDYQPAWHDQPPFDDRSEERVRPSEPSASLRCLDAKAAPQRRPKARLSSPRQDRKQIIPTLLVACIVQTDDCACHKAPADDRAQQRVSVAALDFTHPVFATDNRWTTCEA